MPVVAWLARERRGWSTKTLRSFAIVGYSPSLWLWNWLHYFYTFSAHECGYWREMSNGVGMVRRSDWDWSYRLERIIMEDRVGVECRLRRSLPISCKYIDKVMLAGKISLLSTADSGHPLVAGTYLELWCTACMYWMWAKKMWRQMP